MRRLAAIALTGALVLVAAVIVHRPAAAEPVAAQQPRYEVHLLAPHGREVNPDKVEKVLNDLAENGWQLARTVPYSDAKGPNQLLLIFSVKSHN